MPDKDTSRSTTVSRVFLIVALFIAIILSILFVVRTQMKISVSVRAYVGGEGLWAKAQKDAIDSLEHYASYYDEADYRAYLRLIRVPLGDRKARIELQKPVPDMEIVREGFLEGGNHPDDIEPMAWFFRRFRNVSYMSRAIGNWTRGDQLIAELIGVAEALHKEIASGRIRAGTIHALRARLDLLNVALTKEENEFSATLAEGTRWANKVAQMLVYTIGLLFAAIGVGLSWPIITRIRATEKALFAANEELLHKEKLAILGLIAEGMGNELRNPLGVMNNAVFYLKNILPAADETVGEYLEIIRQEIDNSQQIISDLLDFTNSKPPKRQQVVVDELIRQSLTKCAVPENVAQRVELAELLPMVEIDPLQMGRVMCNLITNAVQAMPDGGELRISARKIRRSDPAAVATATLAEESDRKEQSLETTVLPRSSGDADFVEISVTDSGIGIAPEHMDKLFQPLFTTRSRGIGLGLAISRNLTEANGGRIRMESRLSKGTVFSVTLPVNNNCYDDSTSSLFRGEKLIDLPGRGGMGGGEYMSSSRRFA